MRRLVDNALSSNVTPRDCPETRGVRRGAGGRPSGAAWPILGGWLTVLCATAGAWAFQAPPSDPVFSVLSIDGTLRRGRLVELKPEGVLVLDLEGAADAGEGDAKPVEIAVQEIVHLSREGLEPVPSRPVGAQAILVGGDRLQGVIAGCDDDGVTLLAPGLRDEPLTIPLEEVAGLILLPPAQADALQALRGQIEAAKGVEDLFVLANGDRLEGTLLGIGPDAVEIDTQDGQRALPRSTVEAIALGLSQPDEAKPPPASTRLEVGFRDGSRLTLSELQLQRGELVGKTRFGVEVKPALSEVAVLQVRGPRIVYLSDRPADAAEFVGYVAEHPRVYGRGTTWDGRPLRIQNQPYDHGLGTLPRTLLAYRVPAETRRFQALIAQDDTAGQRGNVIFRVLVDGKEVFASRPLAPRDEPVPVDLDLAGAKLLILIVEFGPGGDIQDSADWIEARLILSTP